MFFDEWRAVDKPAARYPANKSCKSRRATQDKHCHYCALEHGVGRLLARLPDSALAGAIANLSQKSRW
jgi:hypothetical protein